MRGYVCAWRGSHRSSIVSRDARGLGAMEDASLRLYSMACRYR
jgi:hypothetical protein